MRYAKIIAFGLLGVFAFSDFAIAESREKKEDFEARMNANYVGINFFDLVSKLGNPNRIEKLSDGTGLATFFDFEKVALIYGGKKFRWQNLPLYPSKQLAEPFDGNSLPSEFDRGGSDLHISKPLINYTDLNCTRVFVINTKGIVTSFSYQGDSCYHLK